MFALIFGSVFVLCGAMAIGLARTAFNKDRAVASWPRAPGKITSSRVEVRQRRIRDQSGYYRDHTMYEPKVEFTYKVAGFDHAGNQIARKVYSSNKKPDLSRYAPGTDVMVYYDPADPKTAYLELHSSGPAKILTVMGVVFVVIGVLVAVLVTVFGGGGDGSTARTCKSIENDVCIEPTDRFDASARVVHVTYETTELPKQGDVYTVRWIAEDVGKTAKANTVIDTVELPVKIVERAKSYTVNSRLTRPTKGWPKGKYRVEIERGGKVAATTRFTIE